MVWAYKDNFFTENGDRLLRQRLAEQLPSPTLFRIFSAEELDRATAGYSESRIIGRPSSSSTVYKGLLPDAGNSGSIVAVKKWCHANEHSVDRFINELAILSTAPPGTQIARVLGACCHGTPDPLVVYEFVPNGTLHHHIHDLHGSLSWEARLKIAVGTAEALVWLQSAIPQPPVFHRGVTAGDILVDEGMGAKVSDFGARLVKDDCLTGSTIVEGRYGYLEPEYWSNFGRTAGTEKWDVYGFGVVLAELLTERLPETVVEGAILGVWFAEGAREGRLMEMLEKRVREEAGEGGAVEAMGEIAERCLAARGVERPTMREAAEELRGLLKSGSITILRSNIAYT